MLEEPHIPERRDETRPTKNCEDIHKRRMGNIPAIFWNPLKPCNHLLRQDNLPTLQRILNNLLETTNRYHLIIGDTLEKINTVDAKEPSRPHSDIKEVSVICTDI